MGSSSACRIDAVLEVISELWTIGIIHELSLGPRRTLELHACFKGLSTKTLTLRLQKLTRAGVVARKSYPESPPRVEYSLTEMGRELLPVLDAIAETAARWNPKGPAKGRACRACANAFDGRVPKPAPETQPPSGQPGEKQIRRMERKRTDVTLL
ncbi:MAG TPA: helix-turn-helix domain-containing protein [Blastocatellia bacterium]|nr:helix-turn-helix domain-containing protein [Blastocatellia bacterium]